jgi:hypothetical protein
MRESRWRSAAASLHVSGGITWQWEPSDGLSCTTCADPIARPAVSTLYRVTATSSDGCVGSDTVRVIVNPTPIADAGRDTSICAGDGVQLVARGGDTYTWSPVDGLSCSDCADPIAMPERTTRYTVTVTDAYGCSAQDDLEVAVVAPAHIAASVDRTRRVGPGGAALVPVVLEAVDVSRWPAVPIELAVTLDGRLARIERIETTGALMDGWNQTVLSRSPGELRTRFTPGATMRSTDTLLYVLVAGFIGPVDSTEIGLSLDAEAAACLTMSATPGLLRIDSTCGLNLRLIEMLSSGYLLHPTRPNPIDGVATIAFETGLDGPVRLELLDASGTTAALLVDATLPAGPHAIFLNSHELPSGLYTCRLTASSFATAHPIVVVH